MRALALPRRLNRAGKRLAAYIVAAAGLLGCRPTAPPTQTPPPGATEVLTEVARSLERRDVQQLARLLTPHCRQGCPGFVPVLVDAAAGYQAARWLPRAEPQPLLVDLMRVLATYGTVEGVELRTSRQLVFPRRSLYRLQLVIHGRDLWDGVRADLGLLDADLRKSDAGWRLHHLKPALMMTLRRSEAPYDTETFAVPREVEEARRVDLAAPGAVTRPPMLLADLHGDGRPDLVTACGRHLIVYPDGSRVSRPLIHPPDARADGPVRTLAAADWDGDGRLELFAGRYGGRSRLLRVRDDGTLRSTASPRVSGHVTAAVVADFDADGHLDLYVVRHGPPAQLGETSGEPNLLFQGGRGGLSPAPVTHHDGWSLDACAADLDGDGRSDLFVADELGESALYLQRRDALVRQPAALTPARGVMATTCAVGDVNGDGRLDLHVGGRAAGPRHLFGRPGIRPPGVGPLQRRRRTRRLRRLGSGGGLFINEEGKGRGCRFREVELAAPLWATWSGMLDHDSDGDLDILVLGWRLAAEVEREWWWRVAGRILAGRSPSAMPVPRGALVPRATLLINLGHYGWVDGTHVTGFPPAAAAGVMHADTAQPAVVVAGGGGAPAAARWRESEGELHALYLRLDGSGPAGPIGARVEIQAGGQRQVREVGLASGLPGNTTGMVHAGLGSALRAERVTVRWPDGFRQSFVDLPLDRVVAIRKGGHARWGDDASVVQRPISPGDPPAAGDGAAEGPADPRSPPPTGPVVPDDLLSLSVRDEAGDAPLTQHIGERAAVLLLTAGDGDDHVQLCRSLGRITSATGIRFRVVRLFSAPVAGCPAPQLQAAKDLRRALTPGKLLLPLVVGVRGAEIAWIASGSLDAAELESLVLQLRM